MVDRRFIKTREAIVWDLQRLKSQSILQLALNTKRSTKTIARHINAMEEDGVVEKDPFGPQGKRGGAHKWRLTKGWKAAYTLT